MTCGLGKTIKSDTLATVNPIERVPHMNKKLTPEERDVLKYINEKLQADEFHRFYPNDIVVNNKTIDDIEPILRKLEHEDYIIGNWLPDQSTNDPIKRVYAKITMKAKGLKALNEEGVVVRLGVALRWLNSLPRNHL